MQQLATHDSSVTYEWLLSVVTYETKVGVAVVQLTSWFWKLTTHNPSCLVLSCVWWQNTVQIQSLCCQDQQIFSPVDDLLLLHCPLWALVVTRDAQSCGGCCRGGPVSHRGGQVISCSERPPSLTAVSVVRSPPPTSVPLLLLVLLSKMWWIALRELPHAAAKFKMGHQSWASPDAFCSWFFMRSTR